MRLEHGHVGRVPGVREVEPPFLHPAAPVLGADLIGIMKDRVAGVELRDGRVLVGHPIVRPRHRQRIGGEAAVDEWVLLILYDQESPIPRVIEQPAVVRDERRLGLVGTAADHDGVVAREITARERVGTDQLERYADAEQRFRHAVGRAADVTHVRERRQRDWREANLRD